MAGFSSITGSESIMFADNASFDGTERGGAFTTDGQLWIGATASPHVRKNTLTEGTGITITNGPGTITIASTAASTDLHTAQFIVNSSGTSGTGANYTTIAAAITAAVATGLKQTIFIMPGSTGTYTENLTLSPNIDLVAFKGDEEAPNVTIIGNLTFAVAGTVCVSNIRLQTNSAACLTVSGSGASKVVLQNCYLNCTNNTGITYSNSNASSMLFLFRCDGDIGTTGISLFTDTSAGGLDIEYSRITNTGNSTTASTTSTGPVTINWSNINFPLSCSSTGTMEMYRSTLTAGTTGFTTAGTGSSVIVESSITTGTSACISVGAGTTVICTGLDTNSSNANPITGAGEVKYGLVTSIGSGFAINTSTKTPLVSNLGTLVLYTPLAIGQGGTNASSMATTNGLVKYDGTRLVTSSSATLDSSNRLTNTAQPAFLARAADASNVTGDGTVYRYGTSAMTEIFDQGGDFNTNGTFTAPISGRYFLAGAGYLTGVTVGIGCQLRFITSNRSYQAGMLRTAGNADESVCVTVLADMDVGDTATCNIIGYGEAGATDDLLGVTGSIELCWFSGNLQC